MGNSCLAGNLFELLAQIPDQRGRHGRRHPLAAMLTAIVCANGGHYLFVVKDNQPELKAAVAADFQPGFSSRYRTPTTSVAI